MIRRNNPIGRTIDVGHLIDKGPFTPFEHFVVAVVAITVVIDGFDGRLIGFAIVMIAKECSISRAAFAAGGCVGIVWDGNRQRVPVGSAIITVDGGRSLAA